MLGPEDGPQPRARDHRVGRLDPEALPVGAGRGVFAPPERPGEDGAALEQRGACASASAGEPDRCSPSATRRKTTVARLTRRSSSGLQVVPAAPRRPPCAGRPARLAEPHRDHLTDPEPDLDLRRFCHPVPSVSSAGSTISVSTPPVERGCRKATRLPRIPVRGSESISSMPASRSSRACVDVLNAVGDVVQAGPLALEELADGRVGGERAQQLDVAVADVEEHRLDALLGRPSRGGRAASRSVPS